jgi:predicted glycosyltransferase
VAAADLVVSAGGTMNREAVALGVPAYTPFAPRLGAVDRRLIAEGRLTRVERAEDVRLERRREARPRAFRDPELLVDLLLDAGRDVPRRR